MMFLKSSLLVFMVCIGCVYMKQPQLQTHHVMKQAAQTTSTRISCINTYVSQNVNANAKECLDVTAKLISLYSVYKSIYLLKPEVATFCKPSCGHVIFNAWKICNVYNDVKQFADLLIGLCASDKGTTCYSNFSQLDSYYNSGLSCYKQYLSSNTCTSSCSTALRNGAARYGCCVNPPIMFNNGDVKADILFSACGVTRPSACTNSPLTSSAPTDISKSSAPTDISKSSAPTDISKSSAPTDISKSSATKLGMRTAGFVILVIIHLLIF